MRGTRANLARFNAMCDPKVNHATIVKPKIEGIGYDADDDSSAVSVHCDSRTESQLVAGSGLSDVSLRDDAAPVETDLIQNNGATLEPKDCKDIACEMCKLNTTDCARKKFSKSLDSILCTQCESIMAIQNERECLRYRDSLPYIDRLCFDFLRRDASTQIDPDDPLIRYIERMQCNITEPHTHDDTVGIEYKISDANKRHVSTQTKINCIQIAPQRKIMNKDSKDYKKIIEKEIVTDDADVFVRCISEDRPTDDMIFDATVQFAQRYYGTNEEISVNSLNEILENAQLADLFEEVSNSAKSINDKYAPSVHEIELFKIDESDDGRSASNSEIDVHSRITETHKSLRKVRDQFTQVDVNDRIAAEVLARPLRSAEELKIKIELDHQDEGYRDKLNKIIYEQSQVFAATVDEITGCNLEPVTIKLKPNVKPFRIRPYPVSLAMQPEFDKTINEMVQQGILAPADSEFASPCFIIRKADGSLRFLTDFRKLNESLVVDVTNTPTTREIIDFAANISPCFMSKIDLRQAFHQIKIDKQSQRYLTIATYQSACWSYQRLGQGLSSSPGQCQKVISNYIRSFPDLAERCIIYIDDILLLTKTAEEHVILLEKLFLVLRQAMLFAHPLKISLLQRKMDFLGFTLGEGQIKPQACKLGEILEIKRPTNKKQLRSMLGLVNFVSHHIPNYSLITAEISDLLHSNVRWKWTERHEENFQKLKIAASQAVPLDFPSKIEEIDCFLVNTDASDRGVSYMLFEQRKDGKRKLLALGGKSLQKSELLWPMHQKESFGVLLALCTYRYYVQSCKIIVLCDNRATLFIKSLKLATTNQRLLRWSLILSEISNDMHFVYVDTKSNFIADYLSRSVELKDQAIHEEPLKLLNTDGSF